MTKIELKKYGTFLSGRSLPRLVLADVALGDYGPIELDFDGVESFNRSFIGELFLCLSERGIDLHRIVASNLSDPVLIDRVEIERSHYAASPEV